MANKLTRAKRTLIKEGLSALLHGVLAYVYDIFTTPIKLLHGQILYLYQKNQAGNKAMKPHDVVWVDPNNIDYISYWKETTRFSSQIIGGDWDIPLEVDSEYYELDEKPRPYENYIFHKSLRQRYINDEDWENTDLYNLVSMEQIDDGRYKDEESLEFNLQKLDKLFNSIEAEGYKTVYESADSWWTHIPKLGKMWANYQEPAVNISRNGEIIRANNGRHRISIAKILNVDEIPVRILVRHKEYVNDGQDKGNKIRRLKERKLNG